jgi:hypothetical protein
LSQDKFEDLSAEYRIEKVNPKYKGYIRSGAILFHNINQRDVASLKTPRAVPMEPLKTKGVK